MKDAGLRAGTQERILKKILRLFSDIDLAGGSSEMIQKAFLVIRKESGVNDPLENHKSYCMDVALKAYPELKSSLEKTGDRFGTAVRIAMAGNIIDHAGEAKKDNLALFRSIEDARTCTLRIDHVSRLKNEVEKASKILYLADNAGETVFDRILIENLPMDRLVYAVKGTPVSNDATLRDAEMAGLTKIVEVVDNGSDYPCFFLDKCDDKFSRLFDSADLVIAKGQGNMSALSKTKKNIFFLARVRCKVKASAFRLSVGDFVVRGTTAR